MNGPNVPASIVMPAISLIRSRGVRSSDGPKHETTRPISTPDLRGEAECPSPIEDLNLKFRLQLGIPH
jgi:hypothetical protein